MRWGRLLLAAVVVSWGTPLAAQNSVFGIVGLGFPGRPISVPARALGGGTVAFDPLSAVNPAAIAAIRELTVTASLGTSFRSYRSADVAATGLEETRFPLAILAGTVPNTPLTFTASFSTYAERTFQVTTIDTIALRGAPVEVSDRIGSDGGTVDARGALGWQLSRRLSVGVAAHIITGAARLTAKRSFSDSAFIAINQQSVVEFTGFGLSAGAVFAPTPGVRLAASVRTDTKLTERVDERVTRTADLPTSVTGGLMLAPTRGLRLSVTGIWHQWSVSQDGVAPTGARAFDTWEVGTGVQLGGRDLGVSSLPLRIGFRYAQLPFSPTDAQPREIDVTFGSSLPFARNRAVIDFAVERSHRDGAGIRERAWNIGFSFLIRP